jgi:uncharacterized protein (TIGR00106 family)
MHALAEIQVVPIGIGVSLRREVMRAHQIIKEYRGKDGTLLQVELHAFGTNVEGELDDIFAVIKLIHETLHGEGSQRLVTHVKLGTRTDKSPSLRAKTKETGVLPEAADARSPHTCAS